MRIYALSVRRKLDLLRSPSVSNETNARRRSERSEEARIGLFTKSPRGSGGRARGRGGGRKIAWYHLLGFSRGVVLNPRDRSAIVPRSTKGHRLSPSLRGFKKNADIVTSPASSRFFASSVPPLVGIDVTARPRSKNRSSQSGFLFSSPRAHIRHAARRFCSRFSLPPPPPPIFSATIFGFFPLSFFFLQRTIRTTRQKNKVG